MKNSERAKFNAGPRTLNDAVALEDAGVPTGEVWRAWLGDDGVAALATDLWQSLQRFNWIERLYLEAIAYTIGRENHPAGAHAVEALDRIRKDARKPTKLAAQDLPIGARFRSGMYDYRWADALLEALLISGFWRKCAKPIAGLIFDAKKRLEERVLEDEAERIKAHKHGINLESLDALPVKVGANLRGELVTIPQWDLPFVAEFRAELRDNSDVERYGELRMEGWKPRAIWQHLGWDEDRGKKVDRKYRRIRMKIRAHVMSTGESAGRLSAARLGQSDASVTFFLERFYSGYATYQHKPLELKGK